MSTPTQDGQEKQTSRAGALRERPTLRAALAVALLSGWLVALFVGWVAWGLTHLLLVAALAVFPWRLALWAEGGVPTAPGTDQKRESEETR